MSDHGPITRHGGLPDDHESHDDHEAHDHGHGGIGKYLAVFVALCFLTTM